MRKAVQEDLQQVIDLYLRIIDHLHQNINYPEWNWGIHPRKEILERAIAGGELFLFEEEGKLKAAAVLNHEAAEGYDQAAWKEDLQADEWMCLHLFGVDVCRQGTGTAGCFLRELINYAKCRKKKALRLDIIDGNEPARRLYLKHGFESRGHHTLYYENEGELHFEMMELCFSSEA